MSQTRFAVLLLLLSAGTGAAQVKAGKVQPDRLPLGALHVGATAEASVMVFEAGNNPDVKVQVTAPKFVTVLRTATHAQQFGPGNNFVCGTVEVSIDTAAAGDLSGEMTVTVGRTTAKVPVTATVKARRPELVRVLVVGTPFERYATGDASAYAGWTNLVRDAPLDVSYLLVRRGKPLLRDLDLRSFDCVLMTAEGLFHQTADDLKRVRAFAEAGGRVVVTANRFYRGSVPKANEVLAGYGLQIRDEEARAGGPGDVTLGPGDLAPEVAKAGVGSARFYRGSPVAVTDPRLGRVVAAASGVGQPGDGFVAVGTAGWGEVVAVGQSLWWNWVSPQRAQGTDTAKLLRWLLLPPKRL